MIQNPGSTSEHVSTQRVDDAGGAFALADMAWESPNVRAEGAAAGGGGFQRMFAGVVGAGGDQRHAEVAAEARGFLVCGHPHCEFAVCAAQPARALLGGAEQQRNRSRPPGIQTCDERGR